MTYRAIDDMYTIIRDWCDIWGGAAGHGFVVRKHNLHAMIREFESQRSKAGSAPDLNSLLSADKLSL